jgi:hypothetical protein
VSFTTQENSGGATHKRRSQMTTCFFLAILKEIMQKIIKGSWKYMYLTTQFLFDYTRLKS